MPKRNGILAALGRNVRREREAREFTQEKLAEKSGLDPTHISDIERAGGECVFSSDWNEMAQITYEANFGERPHADIYSVPDNTIPPHHILCAGFPCQPFSIAGVS